MIIIGTPYTRYSGYTMNDDRPGGGKKTEADIRTCPHCQAVIKMQEWAKAPVQNFCMKCMQPTCANKECENCIPFIKQIEEQVQIALRRKLLSYG